MNPHRHRVESERVFVKDNDGYIEVHDHNLVWLNPDHYTWISASIDDSVMLYFFEFTGIPPD